MQAAEAMTLLIQSMDERHRAADQGILLIEPADLEREQLATQICVAMLNSMIPVARYRAFVEVKELAKKRHAVANVSAEYTVCATTMLGIQSGLSGVSINDMEIRAIIFEQTATGAHMVSGYEGFTKSGAYRTWFRDLPSLETMPTVN